MKSLIAIVFLTLFLAAGASSAPLHVHRYLEAPREVGSGNLRFLVWNVYTATLFAPSGRWAQDAPFALHIVYHMDNAGEDITSTSVDEMRRQGLDRFKAVMEAGHKRAQPIVMTSIAMSAGMLPSALGVGEGGAFRAPMATAVIGGIIVSTVLSLVVVPSFYLIMDDLSRLVGKLFSRFVGEKEAEPDTPSAGALAAQIAAREAGQAELRARLPGGGGLRAAE